MAEPTQRQTLAALKHGPCCGGACDGARTTREQVTICRRDLAGALAGIERELRRARRVELGDVREFLEELAARCERARDNARWLEELTLPAPERVPVPAEAATAIDEAPDRAEVDPDLKPDEVAASAAATEEAFGGGR